MMQGKRGRARQPRTISGEGAQKTLMAEDSPQMRKASQNERNRRAPQARCGSPEAAARVAYGGGGIMSTSRWVTPCIPYTGLSGIKPHLGNWGSTPCCQAK